jgi:two-component system chemotaxis response regulator CheY
VKALIAEDDFINRRVMQLFLAGYGKCDVADNGVSALQMVQDAHRNNKPYALVCVDATLPGMDGLTLLGEIRRVERELGLMGRDGASVMILSAEATKDMVLSAFRSTCDGFMLKPFRKRELVAFLSEQGLIQDPV